MNRLLVKLTIIFLLTNIIWCANAEDMKNNNQLTQKLYLIIGGSTVSATMEDNVATRALVALLQEGSITYEANDYGGFEKVGALGQTLPSDDKQTTTKLGDIVLYNSNQIVIFYGSNSWSYTKIGSIDNATAEELKVFLNAGNGSVKITLSVSMDAATGLESIETNQQTDSYMLSGVVATKNYNGIVIENGKKRLRR